MYFYEEVALDEMELHDGKLTYPCPCGDTFELTFEDFFQGSEVAQCPTCSLTIRVIASADDRAAFMSKHAIDRPIQLAEVCA